MFRVQENEVFVQSESNKPDLFVAA